MSCFARQAPFEEGEEAPASARPRSRCLGGPLDHLIDGLAPAVEGLVPGAAVAVVGGAIHQLPLRALRDREDGRADRRLHHLIARLTARRERGLVEDAV